MNWFRENKFLTVFLVTVAILAGGMAYLVLGQKSLWETARQDYDAKVSTLANLRSLSPYRDGENLKKIQEQRDEYNNLVSELQAKLIAHQSKISPMDPSAFQGRLRESVSKTTDLAREKGVTLPADFYLGFGRYQKELPRNEVTGLLDWQLTIMEDLVSKLILLKVSSVTEFMRASLPAELAVETPVKGASPLLLKYPIEIGFVGRQDQFAAFLNQISSASQFLIVRAVRVENQQLAGPPRVLSGTEGAEAGPVPATPQTTVAVVASTEASPATPQTLRIIAGSEQVKVQILLDMVQFTPPESTSQTAAKNK